MHVTHSLNASCLIIYYTKCLGCFFPATFHLGVNQFRQICFRTGTSKKKWKDRKKSFPCEYCNKSFVVYRDYEGHVNSFHLKLRPFLCSVCNIGFANIKCFHAHKALCQYTNKATPQVRIDGDYCKMKNWTMKWGNDLLIPWLCFWRE